MNIFVLIVNNKFFQISNVFIEAKYLKKVKIDRVVSGVERVYIRVWITNSHHTFCIDVLNYEFPNQK
jgi:hypothetical protein